MREKKKNIPLGGAQDAFKAPFFPFLFPDLVIVTLWALFSGSLMFLVIVVLVIVVTVMMKKKIMEAQK